MHNVATTVRPCCKPTRNNQVDCLITNTVCNDEALTTTGERFASSTNNPEHSTHVLGLGKAIVVRLPAQSSHIPAQCGRGCVEEIHCSTGMG